MDTQKQTTKKSPVPKKNHRLLQAVASFENANVRIKFAFFVVIQCLFWSSIVIEYFTIDMLSIGATEISIKMLSAQQHLQ